MSDTISPEAREAAEGAAIALFPTHGMMKQTQHSQRVREIFGAIIQRALDATRREADAEIARLTKERDDYRQLAEEAKDTLSKSVIQTQISVAQTGQLRIHLRDSTNELASLRAEIAALKEERSRLPANWLEDASLETWFPVTAQSYAKLHTENGELRDKSAYWERRWASVHAARDALRARLEAMQMAIPDFKKRCEELLHEREQEWRESKRTDQKVSSTVADQMFDIKHVMNDALEIMVSAVCGPESAEKRTPTPEEKERILDADSNAMELLNQILESAECALTPTERAEALENAIRNLATEADQRGGVDLDAIINFVRNATT